MNDTETLLSGPRGRRLLLAYALESQQVAYPENEDWHLHRAVGDAAYDLDPGKGRSTVRLGIGGESIDTEAPAADEVADLLNAAPLAEPTHAMLRNALNQSVMSARYYQEPDGEDILAATEPVRSALRRVAMHLEGSSLIDWWNSDLVAEGQAWIWWDGHQLSRTESVQKAMAHWRGDTVASNKRAMRERPADPTASYSGLWWSPPAMAAVPTSRVLTDGTPAGLWFTEDSGYDTAQSVCFRSPDDANVLEIRNADDWARLCQQYPLDVSAEKRHDWYRASGRVGSWVIPDWSAVANVVDGVHLTVSGYLAASGVIIPVDEDSASFIAGWSPDETWWFIDPSHIGEIRHWQFVSSWEGNSWVELERTS